MPFSQHVTKRKMFHHSASEKTSSLVPSDIQRKKTTRGKLSRIFRTNFRIPFSFASNGNTKRKKQKTNNGEIMNENMARKLAKVRVTNKIRGH